MQPANLQEAFKLARRYHSIQLGEVKFRWHMLGEQEAKRVLTGFGEPELCPLCKKITEACEGCIYPVYSGYACDEGENYATYMAIKTAESPEALLRAYRARARHIYNVIARHIAQRIRKEK